MTPKELEIHQAQIIYDFAKHALGNAEMALDQAKAKECRTINVSSNLKFFRNIVQHLESQSEQISDFAFTYQWSLDEQSSITIWGNNIEHLNTVTWRIKTFELSY